MAHKLPSQTEQTDDVEALKLRVKTRIERLQRRWNDNTDDRKAAKDSVDFRNGDQAEWIKPNADESAEHWAKKDRFAVDVVGLVIPAVASAYDSPPRRSIAADLGDDAEKWVSDHVWAGGSLVDGYSLNEITQDADEWSLYLGTVAVEPRFWEDGEADGIEPILYLRDQFEVVPLENDARKAEACVLVMTEGDFASGKETVRHYWDGEVFARLKGWEIDHEQGSAEDPRWVDGLWRHGLGFLPVVFRRDRRVHREFYFDGVHLQLKRQSKAISKAWTEFLHVLKLQHGYAYTDGKLKRRTLAVDGILEGEQGQQFKVESPKANLENMLEGTQRLMDNVALLFGLSPGSLVMDPQAAASGIALMIQNQAIENVRIKRIEGWRTFEAQFMRAALGVYWACAPAERRAEMVRVLGLDERDGRPDFRLGVDVAYQPPQTLVSRDQKRADLQYQRDNGLIDRHTLKKELDPHLSDQEIADLISAADADAGEDEEVVPSQPPSLAQSFLARSGRAQPARSEEGALNIDLPGANNDA